MNRYHETLASVRTLTEPDIHPLSALANITALLWKTLPDVSWVGFYLLHGGQLCLGPFQGPPACLRISRGCGVCGTALSKDKTVVVDDVNGFAGHIACDPDSRSEVVVPVHDKDGRTIGVLDVDSHTESRFTADDVSFLQGVVAIVELRCPLSSLHYDMSGGAGEKREA